MQIKIKTINGTKKQAKAIVSRKSCREEDWANSTFYDSVYL